MLNLVAPGGSAQVGTVTFLFTDIEGSNKMWEAHSKIMGVSLARHDALMREAIAASHDYVFKTIGDAFCFAFTAATKAVKALLTTRLARQRLAG